MITTVKDLCDAIRQAQRQKYPNFPPDYVPAPKRTDKTANGLTRCIIDMIVLHGGLAERVNVMGRQINGRWTRSHSLRGTADIHATFAGRTIAIEVKIGKDRQSEAQKAYQERIERAGGVYFIAKDFATFAQWFNENFINHA